MTHPGASAIRYDILRIAIGDTGRFGDLQERIDLLIETQERTLAGETIGWLIMPVDRSPSGFYLLAPDREGLRRGQEVVAAFLGPAAASIEPVSLTPAAESADLVLQRAGISQLCYLHRHVAEPPLAMLRRLEDAIATIGGRGVQSRPVRPSHVDLLRDFRLAMLNGDSQAAERALEDLRRTGRLSAENIRFLTVEFLGRLGRWQELRELAYLSELLRARRPRAINELLLEMVWQTEAAALFLGGATVQDVYTQLELGARYGAILSAVDVPATEAGRSVAVIAAIAQADDERLGRLLAAAATADESARLSRLVSHSGALRSDETSSDLAELFRTGRYGAVALEFLNAPSPTGADLAVQAILESEDAATAPAILTIVRDYLAHGDLSPGRRLLRDLEDLERLVDGTCSGWVEWAARLAADSAWPDAADVLRAQQGQWTDPAALSGADVAMITTDLLSAWQKGSNQEQIVASLDVLCMVAASAVTAPQAADLCDLVLILLEEQSQLSAPVRDAYLHLVGEWLDAAPDETRYRQTLDHALSLWRRIASPAGVDWGLSLLDILLTAPVPLPSVRTAAVAEVVGKSRDFGHRLSARQHSELEAAADDAGLESQQEQPDTEDSVWPRLDGKIIGIYSLLPRAGDALAARLARLCSPREVTANADTVSTAALRALVGRANYLIVDTSHAAHAATTAIDQIRPRDQQILPKGRGITGFLQALEQHLSAT